MRIMVYLGVCGKCRTLDVNTVEQSSSCTSDVSSSTGLQHADCMKMDDTSTPSPTVPKQRQTIPGARMCTTESSWCHLGTDVPPDTIVNHTRQSVSHTPFLYHQITMSNQIYQIRLFTWTYIIMSRSPLNDRHRVWGNLFWIYTVANHQEAKDILMSLRRICGC